jgi:dihydroorotase
MDQILIHEAFIVNENKILAGSILISQKKIIEIFDKAIPPGIIENSRVIEAKGKFLFPGVIDEHVHFREPGLTNKGNIYSESKAAIAGGVTSIMDMPNNDPPTTSYLSLKNKLEIAREKSLTNYSFYLGASNENIDEILKIDPSEYCGIKIFLGQSTGNLLIDDINELTGLFKNSKKIIVAHCEDSLIIKENLSFYKNKYGENIPIKFHHLIRSAESCYKSSAFIVDLAKKHKTRLHVLHISTGKELGLFDNSIPLKDKLITSEVCIHHLYFDNNDYNTSGNFIKTNPSVKTGDDRKALFEGILNNKIDTIATDHAPHTLNEKLLPYTKAPSGCPMIQHSLPTMLEFYHDKKISLEKIAEKMCHSPADIFSVEKRGYIRKGYWADLVLVDLDSEWKVSRDNILYLCKWSPMEDRTFHSEVTYTFVNGNLVFENGTFHEQVKGEKLEFITR